MVRIFNVRFSPNLGDGLLAECLESALIACGADPSSGCVDLAARTQYAAHGAGRAAGRGAQLRTLEAMPPVIRQRAVRLALAVQSARQWRPHYRAALESADCMVIGGGNLLADHDLNFPTKLALAIEEAARRGVPVVLYACGASGGWSEEGRRRLHRALETGAVRKVFVRDERSRRIWDALAGIRRNLPAEIVRDPGLLAAQCYPAADRKAEGAAPVFGINVTSQLALRYHGAATLDARALDRWYLELANELLARGYSLCLFTNGSPEDRACLKRLQPVIAARDPGGRVTFPEVRTPAGLVDTVRGLAALAAFRMHAVIAAYSCGVPFLALEWDPKLKSFLRSVERERWLCNPLRTSPREAAAHLLAHAADPVPETDRARVVAEARAGVERLWTAIRSSAHAR